MWPLWRLRMRGSGCKFCWWHAEQAWVSQLEPFVWVERARLRFVIYERVQADIDGSCRISGYRYIDRDGWFSSACQTSSRPQPITDEIWLSLLNGSVRILTFSWGFFWSKHFIPICKNCNKNAWSFLMTGRHERYNCLINRTFEYEYWLWSSMARSGGTS